MRNDHGRGGVRSPILARVCVRSLTVPLLCAALSAAHAAEIAALVTNQKGEPVSDAVVVAVPAGGVTRPPAQPAEEVVDQVNHEFVPRVKIVLVGSSVRFPNKDNV